MTCLAGWFGDEGRLRLHSYEPAARLALCRRHGNLEKRLSEHRLGVGSKFTYRYNLHHLVHYEAFDEVEYAIAREKQLKAWRREWRVALVEKANPHWRDLSDGWWAPETPTLLSRPSS